MSILDETIGPEAWQCRYEDHKGTLFCGVGILVGAADKQGFREWVWKWDAGAPSNMEAQKGEASDAFKRACIKWGIGRSLYTAPRLFVYADKCNIKVGKNGKPQCYDTFKVERIRIEDGRITGIRIRNLDNGMVVISWKED
ncbi:MAG: Rad52/Rad22 family DNA repair protein [Prevotella sp.]